MRTLTASKAEPVFFPRDIQGMSAAFDQVCLALGVQDDDDTSMQIIAERIVELARRGERNPSRLRSRVLREARSKL